MSVMPVCCPLRLHSVSPCRMRKTRWIDIRRQSSSHHARQRPADDRLRFLLDAPQVVAPTKALRVELVDVFRARRTRRKPYVGGDDLQAAAGWLVAWRRRQQSVG